jgi:Uma2 family endonuclease
MPGFEHGEVCMNAGAILREFVKKHGLGRVMGNDTFVKTTDKSTRGADVFFISYARLPKDQPTPRGIGPSPDLVLEVRSPWDRMKELIDKADEYLHAGVAAVVLLFPETKSAAIHRPNAAPVTLAANDTLEVPDILPGFSVPVKAFFE